MSIWVCDMLVGIGCYLIDGMGFQLSAYFDGLSVGVVSYIWVFWVTYLLLVRPYWQSFMSMLGMILWVSFTSVHGFWGLLFPFLTIGVLGILFRAHVAPDQKKIRIAAVLCCFGLFLGLRIIKMSFYLTDGSAYILQWRWVVLSGVNVMLYVCIMNPILAQFSGRVHQASDI